MAGECYVNSDMFGDRDEVVCVFSYAGEEPHALVMVVDYNAGGMLRDGWVTSQVDRLLERCRAAAPGMTGIRRGRRSARWKPPQARRLLETALAVTEAGQRTAAERFVRVLPRVHPGPDPHPAARPPG